MFDRYTLGLDLGKQNDFTAGAILKHVPWPYSQRVDKKTVYHLGHLERVALRTPYPEIVKHIGQLMARLPNAKTDLVVDATGVGAAVVDLFEDAKHHPVGVTITGGNVVTMGDSGYYNVPKRDLITTTQVLLQTGRLRVAKGLELADIFKKELLNFQIKISISGQDTYEAWREGTHDDLVLAVALACWHVEFGPGPSRFAKLMVPGYRGT